MADDQIFGVINKPIKVRSQNKTTALLPGEVVEIIPSKFKSKVLVKSYWPSISAEEFLLIDKQNIATAKDFYPIKKWVGQKEIFVENASSDVVCLTKFNANGTFSSTWDNGKPITSKGRLYSAGSLIWAKDYHGGQINPWSIFYLNKNRKLASVDYDYNHEVSVYFFE
jgi:hypothetical protein